MSEQTYSTTVPTTYELSEEAITDIIDGAGYSIGYWASEAEVDGVAKTYSVTEEDSNKSFVLTYEDIFKACVKLSNREVSIRKDIADNLRIALLDYDEADLDGEVYDCVIQTACFGEVVYG
jgi:hypothetical protein